MPLLPILLENPEIHQSRLDFMPIPEPIRVGRAQNMLIIQVLGYSISYKLFEGSPKEPQAVVGSLHVIPASCFSLSESM